MIFAERQAGLISTYIQHASLRMLKGMKFLIALVVIIVVVMALLWIRKTFSKEIDWAKSIRRAQGKDDRNSR
ncbi:hypothetical protein CQ018_02140 [Arthrobacter sp. MYb227]|nr:hypothetical protein CQ018_02140 [Arthrobacter sp. MYb227]